MDSASETWRDRFVDARFSATEATEWEEIVGPDPTDEQRDAATATLIALRPSRST